ncbi:MAG: DUF3352 domain-containing protein [Cyanobacteria bacterium CRU_2_1]|nr:DUF3352 domain-containing protein [Cyanobacteria bacterium RU_5_0]NJR58536.1 DUF3352 domain-containing protein [Cyanobacteria bacterium CRU_2_1]
MKFRSFVYALASVVLVLLLIGAGGAYWLAANNPLMLPQNSGLSSPKATVFVSKQSPVVMSLLVNPDRLAAYGLAAAPLDQRRALQTRLNRFQHTLLANSQLDYRQDVQPWLGDELTLAVTTTDIDRDTTNGQQLGYLLAATAKNLDHARESIQRYWQRCAASGQDLVFEQYAGVQIVYAGVNSLRDQERGKGGEGENVQSPHFTLATAIVGNGFVLFANSPKVLREAINNLQVPELSLSQSEAYDQALQRLSEPHIGALYVHLPQLAAWMKAPKESPDMLAVDSLPTYDSVVMGLKLDPQGLLGNALLLTTPGVSIAPTPPILSAPVQALQSIPASSPLVIAGRDLRQLWEQLDTELTGYESLKQVIRKPLLVLCDQWGVEPEALLGWIQGEYALGMLPRAGDRPNWILVTEVGEATPSGLERLNALAQSQGTTIGSFTIADQPISVWTKLSATSMTRTRSGMAQRESLTIQAEVQGVHATIGNYEILASSLDAMDQAIHASQNSIMASESFQQAIAPLPISNDGYVYLDGQGAQTLIEQLTEGRSMVDAARPFLEAIQSLTLSSRGSEANAWQASVFIRLKD